MSKFPGRKGIISMEITKICLPEMAYQYSFGSSSVTKSITDFYGELGGDGTYHAQHRCGYPMILNYSLLPVTTGDAMFYSLRAEIERLRT